MADGRADDRESFAPDVAALLDAWNLEPDGDVVTTRSSWVLPVRNGPLPATLKVARIPDERRGYELMRWWDGKGAARVLAHVGNALLLERAGGKRSLADMARSGEDDQACIILCETAARLHAPRAGPPPDLHRLENWFQPLFDLAGRHSRLATAAVTARQLLAAPRSVGPLHGDLHHDNVLDFGERGWLAIDPHGLLGETYFDYANIFTNPDLSDPARPVATLPGRLAARLAIATRMAEIEPGRMLQWIVAWTGLSAAWLIGDGDEVGAEIDLQINGIASGFLSTVAVR